MPYRDVGAVALRVASPLTQAGKTHLTGLVADLTIALFAQPVLAVTVHFAD